MAGAHGLEYTAYSISASAQSPNQQRSLGSDISFFLSEFTYQDLNSTTYLGQCSWGRDNRRPAKACWETRL